MKFSIIIPTYNGAERIGRCLRSIFGQDFPREDYEVIVVDDCSTQDIEAAVFNAVGQITPPLNFVTSR